MSIGLGFTGTPPLKPTAPAQSDDEQKRQEALEKERVRVLKNSFTEIRFRQRQAVREGRQPGQFFDLTQKELIETTRVLKLALEDAGMPTESAEQNLARALDEIPQVPITQFTLGPDQSRFVEQGGAARRIASQGKSFAPTPNTVVGQDQRAFNPSGEPRGEGPTSSPDVQGSLTGIANLVLKLQKDQMPPENIKDILSAMAGANRDQNIIAGIDTLIASLPESVEKGAAQRGELAVKESEPKIRRLMAAGFDESVATAIALGGRSTAVSIEGDPGKLGKTELKDIRTEIRDAEDLRKTIIRILPMINEATVGLFPGISASVGALGQNIPVVRDLFNALPKSFGLDIKSVVDAKTARSAFLQVIGVFSRFLAKKKGKLSNEDISRGREAMGFLETSALPETVRGALMTLLDIVQIAENTGRETLERGDVGSGNADIEVRQRPDGNFDVIRDGKVVDTLTVQ